MLETSERVLARSSGCSIHSDVRPSSSSSVQPSSWVQAGLMLTQRPALSEIKKGAWDSSHRRLRSRVRSSICRSSVALSSRTAASARARSTASQVRAATSSVSVTSSGSHGRTSRCDRKRTERN